MFLFARLGRSIKHFEDRTTPEQAGDHILLVFIKNTEPRVIQHNLSERWLYRIGFSTAQQILPGKKHTTSAQRYMDPFAGHGEEKTKEN